MTENQDFRFWSRYARTYLYEPRNRASTATILTILTLGFIIIFGYIPTIRSIKMKLESINERNQVLSDIETRIKYINSLKPNYDKVRGIFTLTEKILPIDDELPDVLERLSVLAANNGFQVTYFSPNNKKVTDLSAGRVTESKVTVIFEGNLQNVLNLINSIENTERTQAIKNVTVNSTERGVGLLKIDLVVFSYK